MRLYFTSIDRPKSAAKTIVKLSHGISLSTAQNALANAIGYRNWHDLKSNFSHGKPSSTDCQLSTISEISMKLADNLDLFLGDAAWLTLKSHVTGDRDFSAKDMKELGGIVAGAIDRVPSRKGEPNRLLGFMPFPKEAEQFIKNVLDMRVSTAKVLATMRELEVDLVEPKYLGYTFNGVLLNTYQIAQNNDNALACLPDFRLYPSTVVARIEEEHRWNFENPTVYTRSASPSCHHHSINERGGKPRSHSETDFVRAEVHTDNYAYAIKFDASQYLKTALRTDIVDLAACGWGGDYAADYAAYHLEDMPGFEKIAEMFRYLESHPQGTGDRQVGFEVHICAADAMRFLARHRPEAHQQLLNEDPTLGTLDWPAKGSLSWDQDGRYAAEYLTIARQADKQTSHIAKASTSKTSPQRTVAKQLPSLPDGAIGWQIVDKEGYNVHGEEDPFGIASYQVLTGKAAEMAALWAKTTDLYRVVPVMDGDIEEPFFVTDFVIEDGHVWATSKAQTSLNHKVTARPQTDMPFTAAFEVSEIDVQDAMKLLGRRISLDEADAIIKRLNRAEITKVALEGDDLDEQTAYAIVEIKRQIVELGLI